MNPARSHSRRVSNHLGNVLVTVTDMKVGISTDGDFFAEYYEATVVSANDYYPFGSAMAGRKYNQGSYRFGFNGKEEDSEWGSQMIQDYGFRIYNPTIGKFLSVDPLAPEYPWYTPYQFAGNMPIWAIDLDGLEPVKKNGVITGYKVKVGQGPTQIAKDLQQNYGMYHISWQDIVIENKATFEKKANVTNFNDKNDVGYWDMNINENDILNLPTFGDVVKPKPIDTDSPTSKPQHKNKPWTAVVGGIEGNFAGPFFKGVTGSVLKFTPPEDIYAWEAGLGMGIVSTGITASLPGGDITVQLGTVNFGSNSSVSISQLLKKDAESVQVSFVTPYFVGGKYTRIWSEDYNMNMVGAVGGTPGLGVSAGTSTSYTKILIPQLKTKQDSINQAIKVIKNNPNVTSGKIHDYLDENTEKVLD